MVTETFLLSTSMTPPRSARLLKKRVSTKRTAPSPARNNAPPFSAVPEFALTKSIFVKMAKTGAPRNSLFLFCPFSWQLRSVRVQNKLKDLLSREIADVTKMLSQMPIDLGLLTEEEDEAMARRSCPSVLKHGITTSGVALGLVLGLTLGLALGRALGLVLGLTLGLALGLTLGLALGRTLGLALGRTLGLWLGLELGLRLGAELGVITF